MKKPISPDEIVRKFPDAVIEAFDEEITENYSNGCAVVLQDDVVKRITTKLQCDRTEIFRKGWLNIEDIYRKAGWKVTYDKPGYNEDYGASFTFLVSHF